MKLRARHSSQTKIMRNSAAVAMREGMSAAVAGVPRLFMAMVFCMEGEPGAVIDQVQQPG